MKTKLNILPVLLALLIGSAGLFTACSNDDDNATPVIESVRITDPEKADSTFTQATPGSMIVIQGRNLAHATALYINDQEVSFNPNMNTNHSLIATIPSEENGFELTVWNEKLNPEIRLVTPHGSATFAFKVLAPTPSISRIAGKYPREAGDMLTIYGTNFLDVDRVYFSDVNPLAEDPETGLKPEKGNEVDVVDFRLSQNRYFDEKDKRYVADSEMMFTLPQLPFSTGYLVIETPQGSSVSEYAALPPVPVITSISSDMPIPGSTVTIKGLYFINVTGIMFGGNIAVNAEAITVADNESELTFVMPARPDNSTTISVQTLGGASNEFDFYRYENLLVDFDGKGRDLGWEPNAQYRTATPDAAPYVSDGTFGVFDCVNPAWNWWSTMIFFEPNSGTTYELPSYDQISSDTPASEVYLTFEVFNEAPISKMFHYRLVDSNDGEHNWENWNNDTKVQLIPEFQDRYGNQKYGEWYSTVIPLSRFSGFEDMTYGDIKDLGIKRLRFMLLNYTGEEEKVFICVDNIRICTLQSFTPEI